MRPYPLKKETPFQIHEIFFSRTDKKGVIRSFNSTFVKISQYSDEQLNGAPHNLIRHPDMPRAVFKLLWETIATGRPIGAYIKNLSRSGSYYWVFALVLPLEEGYLSLRIKPTSAVFDKIPGLMRAMINAEKAGGIEDSGKLLKDAISSLGFADYREFMTLALTSELQARDQVMAMKKQLRDAVSHESRKDSLSAGERMQNSARHSFVELSAAAKHIIEIRNQARVIISSFRELNLLSINMAVCSEHAGSSGNALAEVTIGFTDVANEIQSQIRQFDTRVDSLIESLADSQFDLGCCRIQAEMITNFMKEADSGEADSAPHEDLELLLQVTHSATDRALVRVNSLMQLFESFLRTLDDLLKTINGLELIRITGKIEISKLGGDHGHAFETHIDQMAEFLGRISTPIRISNESSVIGIKATERSLNALAILKGNLSEVQISSREDLLGA